MNQCPECKAKILWGLADPEQMEGVDVEPGDIAVVGCLLGEENHCPRCGAFGPPHFTIVQLDRSICVSPESSWESAEGKRTFRRQKKRRDDCSGLHFCPSNGLTRKRR